MGYASYQEDIVNRLGHDLRDLNSALDSKGWTPALEIQAGQLLRRSEELVQEILTHWDLATDPELDLAHELMKARAGEVAAKAALKRTSETAARLRKDLAEKDRVIEAGDKKLRQVKKAKRKTDEKLAAAFETDPDKIYDQFMSPEQIEHRKRE